MYNTSHSTANTPEFRDQNGIQRVILGDHFITLRRWPGNGPNLVLVHGISSSGFSWESLIPELAAHFSPITIDLRGHGASGKPEAGYLYDDYIADLDGVLEALALDRPLMMGHSLGGIIALWWAAKHPDQAAGLVIVDSPLRSGHDFSPAFEDWLVENAMPVEDLAAQYRAERPEWNPEVARRRAEEMTTTARNVFAELWADSLAHDGVDRVAEIERISSPVLFFQADPETGSMVHPDDARALSERLPKARVVYLPGSGHSLHIERAEEFLAAAIPFLQECVRGPSEE